MSDNNSDLTLPFSLKESLGLVQLVSYDEEASRVRVEFDARDEFCHSGGVVQGGFVTGWIDAAMAYAIHHKTSYELTPLSLEIKISFLNSARPGRVFAEAWIERLGRSIAFLEGHLLNESGDVIARGSSTVKLFPMNK